MDSRRTRRPVVSTGVVSIVLIFVMLSLLTFAVLSLVSAQADLRLSEKSAQRTTDYYAAENAANAILTDLLTAEDVQAVAAAAGVTLTEDGRASYRVPLGEDQILAVEVTLPADGRSFTVERWQALSDYDWDADKPLNLLGTGGLPVLDGLEE